MPNNISEDVQQYREQNGLDSESEAVRQLIERGIREWNGRQPLRTRVVLVAAKIAAVAGFIAAIIGASLPSTALLQAAGLFAVTALIMGLVWSLMEVRLGNLNLGAW